MKKWIYSLIMLAITSLAYSQCDCINCLKRNETSHVVEIKKGFVKGTIIDKDDNPAIANVIISGETLKNGLTGVQTDEQGSFGIQLFPGFYHVTITQPGHKDYTTEIIIEADKNINMGTIGLKEQPVEITCSNYRSDHYTITKSNTCNLISIKEEDIRRIPSTMSEIDLVNALLVTGCPMHTNEEGGINAQGPITGLEGHNFLEEPALIYPNPVKDIMNVKSTDPITVIEILNLHGEIILTMDPKNELIVSDLAAGTYYARIQFQNKKEVQVEKILIIK